MAADGRLAVNGAAFPTARTTLRARIRNGEPLLGTFVKSTDPMVAELLASAGFDVLVADFEHSALELSHLHDIVRAGEVWNVPTIARIGPEALPEVGRILESGVAGLQVGCVENAETVSALHQAVQFRPLGGRGCSVSHRAAAFGRVGSREFTRSSPEETALIVQIETVAGVAMLPELLRGPDRPDCWFIGAVDLSCDLGYPGDVDHEVVRAAIDTVAAQITSAKRRLGMFVADERSGADWRARGASLVVVGSDVALLARQAGAIVGTWQTTALATEIADHLAPSQTTRIWTKTSSGPVDRGSDPELASSSSQRQPREPASPRLSPRSSRGSVALRGGSARR